MIYPKTFLFTFLVCLISEVSPAQSKQDIQGVWELISRKFNGVEISTGRDVKVITKHHFVWLEQDNDFIRASLAKKTVDDTIRAYLRNSFGFGNYKLKGNTYTETIEQDVNPEMIGVIIEFTVNVETDRLYQSGTVPMLKNGKKFNEIHLEESYKRIE